MKTMRRPRAIATHIPLMPDTWSAWWGIGVIIGFLLWAPIPSHGQHSPPQPANPHADMSEPPLPDKGVIGVAIYVTAERIGDPAGLFIRATHPTGPAARAGLIHGQEILAVDGKSLSGKTYREVVEMIRGQVGQPVTLRIKTFTDVKEVTLTRVGEDQLLSEHQT